MDYSLKIMLLDAIEDLEERLEILFEEEEISSQLYHRKKAYKQLLRAVNKADRHISSFIKRHKTVALFVPAGLRILPLRLHDVYAAKPVESVLDSELATIHPSGIEAFLYKEPWTNVTGIYGELNVYDCALFTEAKTGSSDLVTFKEATQSGFKSTDNSCVYWFDPANFILHLAQAVEQDSFLVFEATTVPGLIDVKEYNVGNRTDAEQTDLEDYTLDAPMLLTDIVLQTALGYLLPTKAAIPSAVDLMNAIEGMEHGNGAVVYNILD